MPLAKDPAVPPDRVLLRGEHPVDLLAGASVRNVEWMEPWPPSGRQVVLVHGDHRAVVVEVGGGIRSYHAGGRSVVDGYSEDQVCSGGRGQPLLPWPNRLADGRYQWGGTTLQLAINEPATSTAIHGLTRWSRWDTLASATSWATMAHRLVAQPGYPWTLDATITYRLDDRGLSVSTSVVNRSADAAPFGIGFHPYLAAFGGVVDDCTLTLPAAEVYEVDTRGLPTGLRDVGGGPDDYRSGCIIGGRHLDLPLTGMERGGDGLARALLESPADSDAQGRRTTLWMDEAFTHVQVYSGDTLDEEGRRRRALAVEPMTGPANLLASGDGRITLEPGEAFSAAWGIEPG